MAHYEKLHENHANSSRQSACWSFFQVKSQTLDHFICSTSAGHPVAWCATNCVVNVNPRVSVTFLVINSVKTFVSEVPKTFWYCRMRCTFLASFELLKATSFLQMKLSWSLWRVWHTHKDKVKSKKYFWNVQDGSYKGLSSGSWILWLKTGDFMMMMMHDVLLLMMNNDIK